MGAIRDLTCLPLLLVTTTPLLAFAVSLPPGVSDMVEITDDSGTPVTGSDGKPAVAMILESAESTSGSGILPYRPNFVTLTVGSFQSTGSQATSFALVDPGAVLPGCRSGCTSDQIVVLGSGGGFQVSMCSVACDVSLIGYNPGVDAGNGSSGNGGLVTETGQPQEIDVLPSPVGSGNLHVIVDSIDAVPEPSTAALLVAGLGVLSVARRQKAAYARNDRGLGLAARRRRARGAPRVGQRSSTTKTSRGPLAIVVDRRMYDVG